MFHPRPLEPGLLAGMAKICSEFRPFAQARAVLVTDSPEKVFKGAVGHYGSIKGASAFIAFIGDMQDPYVQEKAGYTGEGIILEATALNIATCWVGALFRPDLAASLTGAAGTEKVLAVTPVGYAAGAVSLEERIMSGFGRNHRRKPLEQIAFGLEEKKRPGWMKAALDAARLAPSAVNRQPWRFRLENDCIIISVDDQKNTYNISKRLDCGIAMLHAEVAALSHGVRGGWELLEAPDVACFRPS